LGIVRASKGRMAGRQAQMMPMLTSTADREACAGLSQDMSAELDMLSREESLMTDMSVTLSTCQHLHHIVDFIMKDVPRAQCEHRDQPCPLTFRNLKRVDDRQWHEEYEHVLSYVQARIGEPYDELVHALTTRYVFVPGETDRITDEDAGEDGPATSAYDYTERGIACFAEASHREGTEILDENGYFGDHECEIVDPEACPESLQA
jgi:hypothetical protein